MVCRFQGLGRWFVRFSRAFKLISTPCGVRAPCLASTSAFSKSSAYVVTNPMSSRELYLRPGNYSRRFSPLAIERGVSLFVCSLYSAVVLPRIRTLVDLATGHAPGSRLSKAVVEPR